MPFINRSDAEAIAHPHFARFVTIARNAWSDWMTAAIAPQMRHKRVRANYVWNQLLNHAQRQFEGISGVRVETMDNWDGVLIQERVFVRMKKGSHQLLSRNYPTQAALAFNDTTQDLFGGIARLELIYVLNKAETAIERVALVQRHRSTVAWFIDLLDDANDASVQTAIPFTQPPLPGTVADRLVKPKEGKTTRVKREPKQGT